METKSIIRGQRDAARSKCRQLEWELGLKEIRLKGHARALGEWQKRLRALSESVETLLRELEVDQYSSPSGGLDEAAFNRDMKILRKSNKQYERHERAMEIREALRHD